MSNKKWVELRKGADFRRIAGQFQISPVIARILRNREITSDKAIEEFLYGDLSMLHDGFQMKDMQKTVEILAEKLAQKKAIRIIGDYDIDGVHATYLLFTGLQKLGAVVDTVIPDRIEDGYGLNQRLLQAAKEDGIDTILTCDNGIAAFEEIRYGKEQGLTILVTDHHEVPYEKRKGERIELLPPADGILNPKQKDCPYPFRELCGAAVAYKLLECLYQYLQADQRELHGLLAHVAMATVGDLMPLTGENRILVQEGLRYLREGRQLGLTALMECNSIDRTKLSAYHIGFVLGPCLNAAGRLDTAKRALSLLLAQTPAEAYGLARELTELNESRKELTSQAIEQAVRQVEQSLAEDVVLVVYLPDCHESIAGIVAGRLREKYYRPVFVLTKGKEEVKGSGRSISPYAMYDKLSACKELLSRFGGHAMAAGLSLPEEHIAVLRERLNQEAELGKEDLREKVEIDLELSFAQGDLALAKEVERLAPFGRGNAKPLFATRNVKVCKGRILGKHQNVLKLWLRDARGLLREGVYFGDISGFLDEIKLRYGESVREGITKGAPLQEELLLTIAYTLGVNAYRGTEEVELTIREYLL